MDGSEDYRASAHDLAWTFGLLYERNFCIAFSDLVQFKVSKDLQSYPVSFIDLESNLSIFGNLLGAILGETHPLTTSYWTFWNAMMHQYRIQIQQEIDVRRVIKLVHILHNIQLICFHWFSA